MVPTQPHDQEDSKVSGVRSSVRAATFIWIGLIALTIASYARTLAVDFVWDDAFSIQDNRSVSQDVPIGRYFTDRSTTTSRPDFNTRIYRPVRNIAF